MGIFEVVLILATLLCSLTAGFVLAFALVVMPGIGNLDDREYLRAFQVIDGVIQKGQPIFMLVWIGSVVALLISTVLAVWHLDGASRLLLIFVALIYVLGVQLPTFTVNVPLNNKLQAMEVDALSETTRHAVRKDFEPRWVLWNSIRTVLASLASLLLIVLLLRV